MINLTVIVVSWNVKDYLKSCLKAVQKACADYEYEIIVIDNASADGSAAMVSQEFPQVKLIANSENVGFSRANNQGIQVARGQYLMLLNPDTLISQAAVKIMVDFIERHPETGLVGPEQVDENRKLRFTCSRWSVRGVLEFMTEKVVSIFSAEDKIIFRKPYRTMMLNAGCWLVRREVFEKVGLLNEELFLYGEEPDFCGRVKKAGWQIGFLRQAVIIHYREKSIEQTRRKTNYSIDFITKLLKRR